MAPTYQKAKWMALPGLPLSFLLLASCGKQGEPAAPLVNYSGQVNLYDEFGAAIRDASGVQVSLYDGTSIATQTAADGLFTLKVPATGEHRLSFKKESFGTYYSTGITATDNDYTFSKHPAVGSAGTPSRGGALLCLSGENSAQLTPVPGDCHQG